MLYARTSDNANDCQQNSELSHLRENPTKEKLASVQNALNDR